MFEDKTYEEIRDNILRRLPDDEDISPHTPLYIMSGPTAQEILSAFEGMDFTLQQISPLTANRLYLEKDALTYNITPYEATASIVEGEFDIELSNGERFSKDSVNFYVTEYISKDEESGHYHYRLACEQTGEAGNVAPGKLIPIWTIPNLKYAYLVRTLIPGEEVEETEDFRERYLGSFRNKRFGANLADYITEVCALDGVGRVKILRCVNFKGETEPEWVGIVFTDSEDKKPTPELVSEVQEAIHPLGVSGLPELATSGLGIAAIGQLAIVRGVNEENIRVGLNLTYEEGYSWDALKEEIENTVKSYFQKLASGWGDITVTSSAKDPMKTNLTVKRSDIESLVIDITGVFDSTDIQLNGKYENIKVAWDAIPVLEELYTHSDHQYGNTPEGSCPHDCPDCTCAHDASCCPRMQGASHG